MVGFNYFILWLGFYSNQANCDDKKWSNIKINRLWSATCDPPDVDDLQAKHLYLRDFHRGFPRGTSAQLECAAGYVPASPINLTITCQLNNGTWSPDPANLASCSPVNCSSFDTSDLEGLIKYRAKVSTGNESSDSLLLDGTNFRYQCSPGEFMDDNNLTFVDIKCGGDGYWLHT